MSQIHGKFFHIPVLFCPQAQKECESDGGNWKNGMCEFTDGGISVRIYSLH
jgi:hypothetical protein